ncbi:MAG: D-alanine--D-alanine ligase [Candidatus Omnitrophica bacterium]|nr:D-alanine--D-alanine ligase [Candidatus Omnitrophota bacterium]
MDDPKSFGKVGVFLGGRSRERRISLRSGRAVYQALKAAGVDVVRIDTANGFRRCFTRRPLDLAFIALHGAGGEDGVIQKFFARKKIPYVGSDSRASALAFNKGSAKRLFRRSKILTAPCDILTRQNWKRVIGKWTPPYVIKPLQEGSSFGIFFIEGRESPAKRIVAALKQYPRLLIEKKIEGREFTVGILGNRALPVIELRPKRRFYDFKAKYTKGFTDYLVPAPISRALAHRLQAVALRAHRRLGMRDLSRVDFKVDPAGRPYVLEINSIPGFTEMSLLPKAARQAGVGFTELCLTLLRMARQRANKKN